MKVWIVSVLICFLSSVSVADGEYCAADEMAAQMIDQLRALSRHQAFRQAQVKEILQADACVRSKLMDEEIDALVELLFSDDYAQDTAEQIIGEFIAL